MKRLALLIGVMMFFITTGTALAVSDNTPSAPNGLTKGKSDVQHLYLFEKDPSDWTVIEDGAFGKMTFDLEKFVFNGHGLIPEENYTLIRYTDPWPGTPVTCLANGESNKGGNLHLSGTMMEGGVKVWLVLSDDVNCDTEMMVGWHPVEYLFEYDLL